MDMNEETTQTFSVLNDVKLSAEDKADVLETLRFEMDQKKPRGKFTRGAVSRFAAAAAAVVIVAGGFDFELHHHQSIIPSSSKNMTTASNQTQTNNSSSTNNRTTPSKNNASNNAATYANEVAVIKNKGYSVTTKKPNASTKTASGGTLSAWLCILSTSQDGHNQRVLFFLNGNYVGTDAKPSPEITNAKPAGMGSIAVTYPVYKSTDSLANPTGTPVTITYTWNGSKLVQNKPYPKQFN